MAATQRPNILQEKYIWCCLQFQSSLGKKRSKRKREAPISIDRDVNWRTSGGCPVFQICVFLYRFISNRYIVRVERRLCDVRWRAWDFFHCSAGFDLSLCAVCSRFLHFISIQLLHNTSLALAATLLSCHNWSTFILFFWYLFCTCFLFSSTFLPFYFCHVGYYLMLCYASSLNSFCFHPHTHTRMWASTSAIDASLRGIFWNEKKRKNSV